VLGNPGDPAAAFASNFLNSFVPPTQGKTPAESGQDNASTGAASQTPTITVRDFDPTGTWDPNAPVTNLGADGSLTADISGRIVDEYSSSKPNVPLPEEGQIPELPPVTVYGQRPTPEEIAAFDAAMSPEERAAFYADNGLNPDGTASSTPPAYDFNPRQTFDRIEQMANDGTLGPRSRAGLYIDFVEYHFSELSQSEQLDALIKLNEYANSLHTDTKNPGNNGSLEVGLNPGSIEARRADLAVRMAADLARQSGAIPETLRFSADYRQGFEYGLGTWLTNAGGRLRAGEEEIAPGVNVKAPSEGEVPPPINGEAPSAPLPNVNFGSALDRIYSSRIPLDQLFPELIGVNPHYVENAGPGVNTNCALCVNAAQARLTGRDPDAVAGPSGRYANLNALLPSAPFGFLGETTPASVISQMQAAGNGAARPLVIKQPGGVDHVINVVNRGGQVYFIDTQIRSIVTLRPDVPVRLGSAP